MKTKVLFLLYCVLIVAKCSADKDESSDDSKSKALDLGTLISSGKPLSIKSKETDTLDKEGNMEKRIKEIEIGSPGSGKEDASSSKNSGQTDSSSVDSLVAALKTGLSNATLANLNSPLTAAKGGPVSNYPSIGELSKGLNNNNTETGPEQAVSAQAPINQTSHAETVPDAAPSAHASSNESHSEATMLSSDAAPHNANNETHAETQTASADASHTPSNETTGKVSSDALPAASADSPHPQTPNNQTTAEVAGGSASESPKASQNPNSQIALLPISLPSALVSQIQNAMNGNNSSSSNPAPSSSSLQGNNTSPTEKEAASMNKNETVGLRRDTNVAKVEKGTGEGVIFLTKLMSNKEISPLKESSKEFNKFDINISYEEEPGDDDDE